MNRGIAEIKLKKCNCTKANRTGKRFGVQTTQNGLGCTKYYVEPSEMLSKQANKGKTRVKKIQGDWYKEFEWLRREGEGPMF